MSETPTAATADDTKPCKVCAEAIKKAARVCIHCNNYQDWRAELNISSTVLSLLVAFFGVLTVALPAINTFITPKNSNLIFSYEGWAKGLITLLVTNNGVRPGTVHSVLVDVTDGSHTVSLVLILTPPEAVSTPGAGGRGASKDDAPGAARIIEGGKSELINFYQPLNGKTVLQGFVPEIWGTCLLHIAQTDFQGTSSNALISLPCIQLGDVISPPLPAG